MFPRTIQSDMTIYNAYEDSEGLQQLLSTVIKGVFFQSGHGAHLAEKGVVTTDKVSVVIPKNTEIEGKSYIPSLEFMRLSDEDKLNHWTISNGDKFVNQEITEQILKAKELEKKYGYNNVFTVTEFGFNDFGSESLRHFKIMGR